MIQLSSLLYIIPLSDFWKVLATINMKNCIGILIGLLFVLNSVSANDENRKEQKALVETIKKEYVLWVARDYQDWLTASYEASAKFDTIYKSVVSDSQVTDHISNMKLVYKPDPVVSANKIKDFEFSISNNQAVVKFRVDQLMKSAFLEKESGEWKLICIANLNPVL